MAAEHSPLEQFAIKRLVELDFAGVDVSFTNSIIFGNDASQVYFRSTGDDVEISVNYSLVQNGEDGIIDNDNGDVPAHYCDEI